MPFGEEFSDFADYVLKNYVAEDALFRAHMWAREPTPTHAPNTTNSAEGFHRQFNAQFTGHHPNMYMLIESLLEIQAST